MLQGRFNSLDEESRIQVATQQVVDFPVAPIIILVRQGHDAFVCGRNGPPKLGLTGVTLAEPIRC